MPELFPTQELEPTQETAAEETTANLLQTGKTWLFDFETGDFVRTPDGRVKQVDGLEVYIQWARKSLATPRYKHLAYTRDYGQEFEDLIGRGLTKQAIESEIQRIVTETLMVNPQTVEVGQFSFEWQEDAVFYTCSVMTVFGEAQLEGRIEEVM